MSKTIGSVLAKIKFVSEWMFFARLHTIYAKNETKVLKYIVVLVVCVLAYMVMPESLRSNVNYVTMYVVDAIKGDAHKRSQVMSFLSFLGVGVFLSLVVFEYGRFYERNLKTSVQKKVKQPNQSTQYRNIPQDQKDPEVSFRRARGQGE
jgi:hypothetical protein